MFVCVCGGWERERERDKAVVKQKKNCRKHNFCVGAGIAQSV